MHTATVIAWSVLAILILTTAGILGVLTVSDRLTWFQADPSATPDPTVSAVADTSYSVLILNATPQQGLASDVKQLIVAAGWPAASVNGGAAEATDFEHTIVYYATPDDESAALGLAEVIGGARLEQSDAYQVEDDPETPDVDEGAAKRLIVVIGQDALTTDEETDPDESQ